MMLYDAAARTFLHRRDLQWSSRSFPTGSGIFHGMSVFSISRQPLSDARLDAG
jgi:hypothetical protein